MFSSRLPARLTPNAVSVDLARLRAAGVPLVDLTETNPTAAGLAYPPDLLAPLADARSLRYRPAPFGDAEARGAVAASYGKPRAALSLGLKAQGSVRQRHVRGSATPWSPGPSGPGELSPDRVILTSSTSEAYSMLFKLLCDPGDAVLVPRPSYPLFDLLGALDAVRLVP